MKGATKMINEIERIKEEQKFQVLNETILALLCIDRNGYDLKNRYLIGAEEKFNEDTKRYRYFAYIDNEKINITKDEYRLIRNLWAITKKTKKNDLFTLRK